MLGIVASKALPEEHNILSMIRCCSSVLTPVCFSPSLLQIACRVLLSIPPALIFLTRMSTSFCVTPIEAILEKLTNREASICGQIHRDQRDLKKRIISGE